MTKLHDCIALLFAGMLIGASITAAIMMHKHRDGVWVPCGVAEISPDIPSTLRDWCRKQKSSNRKQESLTTRNETNII